MIGINPQYLDSFKSWADQITPYLEKLGYIPQAEESDWENWAIRINQIPQISAKYPPDPYSFPNWKDWASRFLGCLNT